MQRALSNDGRRAGVVYESGISMSVKASCELAPPLGRRVIQKKITFSSCHRKTTGHKVRRIFRLHREGFVMTSYPLFVVVAAAAFLLAGCEEKPERAPPKTPSAMVAAVAETAPVADSDDAADDSAIWINAADPARSLIIGTNKRRGLVVYGLDGKEIAKRDDGRMNNVDLRQDVTIGEFQGDLVAATNRDKKSIDLYEFDGATATLTPLASIATGFADPYGLCMYRSAESGDIYIFASNADDGVFGQWRIKANDDALEGEQVRNFGVGSQAEGCAADDENGILFVAEEDVALYAYWAEPDQAARSMNARVVIDTTTGSGRLTADAEGVAIYKGADGSGYVIVSSQGSNSYNVYDRTAPYAFRGAFQIGPSSADIGIDGVEETDGIEVTSVNLGGPFSEGLFIAQDGFNYEGMTEGKRANQNFKLVPWSAIRAGLNLPEAAPVIESIEPVPEDATPAAPN